MKLTASILCSAALLIAIGALTNAWSQVPQNQGRKVPQTQGPRRQASPSPQVSPTIDLGAGHRQNPPPVAQLPDLKVDHLEPVQIQQNQLGLTFVVVNIGQTSSAGTLLEARLLSASMPWSLAVSGIVPALAPNEMRPVTVTIPVSPAPKPGDKFQYTVVIDPKNELTVAHPGNKASRGEFELPKPDLTVEILKSDVNSEGRLVVDTRVTNKGIGVSPPTDIQVRISQRLLATESVKVAINPNQSIDVPITIAEVLPPGEYSFVVTVNPNHTIPEDNFANNSATRSLPVPSPKPSQSNPSQPQPSPQSSPVIFLLPTAVVLIVLGGLVIGLFKLLKRRTVKPHVGVPTFAVHPKSNPGAIALKLPNPDAPRISLGLRTHVAASSRIVEDGRPLSEKGR
jgi:hypothetical protein